MDYLQGFNQPNPLQGQSPLMQGGYLNSSMNQNNQIQQQLISQALLEQELQQNQTPQFQIQPTSNANSSKPSGGLPGLGGSGGFPGMGSIIGGGGDSSGGGGLGSLFGMGGDTAGADAAGGATDAGGAGADSGLAAAGPFGWAALAFLGADQLSDGRSTRALNAASGIPGTGGDTDQGDWSILRDGGLSKMGAPSWINPQNWFNG